jgi:hypothetical protein
VKRFVELDKNDIEDAIHYYLKAKYGKEIPHSGKWEILDYDDKNKIVNFIYHCCLSEHPSSDFPNSALLD